MRTLYWLWATLVFVAVIVQVGFAGYGAFYAANKLDDDGSTIDEDVFFHGFTFHAAWGYIVVLLGLILLVIGVAAGIGKWRLGRHGVLFALLVLQVLLHLVHRLLAELRLHLRLVVVPRLEEQ